MSDAYMKFYHEFLQKKNTFTDGGSSGGGGDEGESKLPKEKEQKKGTLKLSKEKKDKVDQHLSSSDMEHSYTRDLRPQPVLTGLAPARTLLVRRPPQCPSCHTHPADENNDGDDANQPIVPSYNETAAKDAMNECSRIAKSVKNANSDDQNWEERVSQSGWSSVQSKLFEKVVSILDSDQLGRLANTGRPHEPVQRRVVVDKSAQRMRKALASVQWEPRITQWLHGLLMECLPPSYMASYLDILQTLKAKLPTLIDKMLFGRPMNTSQELLAPVLKKQWEPTLITQKSRKLPQPAVIIALPSMPISGPVPSRIQKWYQHLATITQIVQVTLPSGSSMAKQPLDNIAEQIVSLTRLKIQELRNEQSSRNIILIGFNAGAALALQVAMVENVSSVVCMGLAFNTLNGVRGTPDDRILDIKVPILFVVGQNSARSSQEEIESLREKMHSDSALVVVGSADDVLRVPKSKRKIENVTQSMVDTMVIDEVYEFIKKIILHPPGPRTPIVSSNIQPPVTTTLKKVSPADTTMNQRKRKQQNTPTDAGQTAAKVKCGTKTVHQIGRPRTRPLPPEISSVPQSTPVKPPPPPIKQQTPQIIQQPSNDDLNLAIQSILGDGGDTPTKASDESRSEVTNFEIVTQPKSTHIKTILGSGMRAGQALSLGTGSNTKIKMIPSNQFVQLKPPIQSQTKIYTIKPTSLAAPSPTTSAPTVSGSQIFTIKPNTSVNQAQIMSVGGQSKFTILKTSPIKTGLRSTTIASSSSNTTTTNDLTNIFDMPIIFADNDGNLTESVSISKAPITTSTPIVLTQPSVTQNKGGTYVINTTALQQQQQQQLQQQQQKPKTNKVVFINRNTMKPCPNIISRSPNLPQLQKYAKVVVKNPNTSTSSLVSRPAQTQQLIKTSDRIIKPLNLHGIKSTSPLASSVTPQMPSTSSPGILNLKQFQIVNMDPDKKKFIKSIPPTTQNTTTTTVGAAAGAVVGSSQTLNKTVFIKQSGLKPLPDHLKPQFLAKNVTVRKLVNLVPTAKTSGVITTTVSQLQSGAAAATANSTAINSGGSVVTPTTTLSLSTILKSKHHQSM